MKYLTLEMFFLDQVLGPVLYYGKSQLTLDVAGALREIK